MTHLREALRWKLGRRVLGHALKLAGIIFQTTLQCNSKKLTFVQAPSAVHDRLRSLVTIILVVVTTMFSFLSRDDNRPYSLSDDGRANVTPN